MKRTQIAVMVALVLGAGGCAPVLAKSGKVTEGEGRRRGLLIRAYEVPDGSVGRYRAMARSLLRGAEGRRALGRVAVAPDGRLVVVAPASVHEDLGPLFEPTRAIARAPSEVAVTYWVVGAKRAAGGAADPGLAEIGGSLEKISERDGGLSFRLVDRIAVQSTTETRASHRGQRTQVEQSLRARGGLLLADLQIRTSAAAVGPLDTSIAIRPDEAVVVGETSVEEGDERLIYVVRATLR